MSAELTEAEQRRYNKAWRSVVHLPGETTGHWMKRQQENKERRGAKKKEQRPRTVIPYTRPIEAPEEYPYACETFADCTFEGTCLEFCDHLREFPDHQSVDRWGVVFEFGYYKYRRLIRYCHAAYDKAEQRCPDGARLGGRRPVEDRSAKYDTDEILDGCTPLKLHRSIRQEAVLWRNKPRRRKRKASTFEKAEHTRLVRLYRHNRGGYAES